MPPSAHWQKRALGKPERPSPHQLPQLLAGSTSRLSNSSAPGVKQGGGPNVDVRASLVHLCACVGDSLLDARTGALVKRAASSPTWSTLLAAKQNVRALGRAAHVQAAKLHQATTQGVPRHAKGRGKHQARVKVGSSCSARGESGHGHTRRGSGSRPLARPRRARGAPASTDAPTQPPVDAELL